jgi:hypothetical protein
LGEGAFGFRGGLLKAALALTSWQSCVDVAAPSVTDSFNMAGSCAIRKGIVGQL